MSIVDWLIIGVLGFLTFRGFKRGFVSQIMDVLGAVIALIAAFRWFEPAGRAISGAIGASTTLGNILGFILIAVAVSGGISFLGARWRGTTLSSPVSLVDNLGGALLGAVKGVLIAGFVLVTLGAIPFSPLQGAINDSGLAGDISRTAPVFYGLFERTLPASVPRLLITPEGLQLRRARVADLDGATCLSCRGKVRFEGFFAHGLLYVPRVTCTRCGRTSDGCQTFEGYHQIYGRCALEKAEEGTALDCQSWPNNRPVMVKGACPVCGKRIIAGAGSVRP